MKRTIRNRYVGLAAFATLALLLVGGVSAFGFGKGLGSAVGLSDEERSTFDEFHDAVQTAIEHEDYATWRDLMESQLTQEHFELLIEHHAQMQEMQTLREEMRQAREDGDAERFEELRTQIQALGPSSMGSFGQGMRMQHGGLGCSSGNTVN